MSAHILIVQAPFYTHINAKLMQGATDALKKGGATFDVVEVPGAMEIPAVIGFAEAAFKCEPHQAKRYDGYVAIGCVIRGETTHYDYVAGECCRALMDLTLTGLAIGNGVLTVENEAQALVRSDPSKKNKGGDAANACLSLIRVRNQLRHGIE